MKHDSCDEKRREGLSEKRWRVRRGGEGKRERERESENEVFIIITELSDAVSNMMLNYRIYSVNKNVQYR